jgi:putative effector of murein hydrolase
MLPSQIFRSTLSKSITTSLGVVLTNQIGGDPAIAVALKILTSIIGFYLAPPILKWLRLDNPISMGLALGITSNFGGASKAVEIGETESAMSAIAIPVTGIITVVLIPIFLQFGS